MKIDSMYDAILAPCSPESPCGEDMSFSAEFDRIQEARREDDPTVDYGEWQTELKQADWPLVVELCTQLLASKSKDMRLSAWLAEGLVKTTGIGGLEQGLRIVAELLERFGQDIHPQAEDGDQERRIGNLTWLISRIAFLVRQVPLTEAKTGAAYNLNDYDSARQLQAQLLRDPDSVKDLESKTTLEKITNAVRKTHRNLYAQWQDETETSLSTLQRLMEISDRLFGIDGPSFSALQASLEEVQMRLKSILNEIGMITATPAKNTIAATENRVAESVVEMPVIGGVRSREQALAMLRDVAAFFRQTEPHSPVAYLADKAAQWGTMPLHAWLRAVVKDRGTLSGIEELLGLDQEDADS
jgi:type VI secretion system protein ImpA